MGPCQACPMRRGALVAFTSPASLPGSKCHGKVPGFNFVRSAEGMHVVSEISWPVFFEISKFYLF